MNGIDSAIAAALVANRVESLTPVGPRPSTGATQAGVSALATGSTALPATPASTSPPSSTETVLSAVALTLDAIVRSGGEATAAVVGQAPVWSNPPDASSQAGAALAELAAELLDPTLLGLLDEGAGADAAAAMAQGAGGRLPAGATGAAGAAGDLDDADDTPDAAASGTTGTAQTAATTAAASAQNGPVAQLAAALQRTVADSGLFYESHLAQWLAGQRTPAALADEPQNRLVQTAAQLPLDWAQGDVEDVLWSPVGGGAHDTPGAQQNDAASAQRANTGRTPMGAPDHFADVDVLFDSPTASTLSTRAGETAQEGASPQPGAATVHPAVIPLVRQQLDLLATGEFRWTGEAWPGARFDWSIQQERDDPRRSRGLADPAEGAWRTRVTLSLRSLGTVDAELSLTGSTLTVRVQASPGGAARLAGNSEALRGRLEAAGLELAGLSIREIGGGTPQGTGAAEAAGAWARAAAQQATPSTQAPQAAGESGNPRDPAANRTPGKTPAGAQATDAAPSPSAPRSNAAATTTAFDWELE